MSASLAKFILRLFGWRSEGQPPDLPKYVMIAAPHTSNWDFPITVLFAMAYRIKPKMMMKHTMFRWPFGYLFRALGAVPIDRRSANNVVSQTIEQFKRHDKLIMLIPPEGTRSNVRFWKSGFYHIAHGAGVPISLAFMDFKRKVAGFGPLFTPSGDIQADMALIQQFYASIAGKNPAQFGEIAVRPDA
jgi:1-acyl-sn-glycerol-3-phosphate acyltransferase